MPSAKPARVFLEEQQTAAQATVSKQSRNRSKASCIECYRRKQKCNRKWPCNHCLDRRVGHLCQFNVSKASARGKGSSATTRAKPRPQQVHDDNQSVNEASDDDDLNTASGTSSPPSLHSPHSPAERVCVNAKSLDGLGYLNNNANNLLGYLKNLNILEDVDGNSATKKAGDVGIGAEVKALLKKVPDRVVTDILIQHFLSEANWIYEMVYAATFLERYNLWWSQPCQSVDDLEFAVLLLRLCSYSAQFLPSQSYTADTILGKSLYAIREQCDASAIALSQLPILKKAPPSITRIHQLFFRACYLKNEGEMKDSWDVLSEAIREAHEMGLHLDLSISSGRTTSEYELEMSRRTYWNLWLWDKFMSIILGRWPLIPDQHCNVALPHGSIGTTISDVNAPNIFCERKLQIELTKVAINILTSCNGKPSADPVVIESHMQRLKAEIIDQLPPAFRLYDPETKWDEQLPNLKRQREMFRISIFATICSLLRPILAMPASQARALAPSDRSLATEHRISLVDAVMEMLDSVGRLHMLMGGKHNRFFLLSFFTLEPAVMLGIYLMNPTSNSKESKQDSIPSASRAHALGDQDRWKQGWKRMEEALARLEMLSEVSSIARTGLKILKKLVAKIDNTKMARLSKATSKTEHIQPTASFQTSQSPPSDSCAPQQESNHVPLGSSATTTPLLMDGVTTDGVSNLPGMHSYHGQLNPSQASPLFSYPNAWSSVGQLIPPNNTSSIMSWDVDRSTDFINNSSNPLNGGPMSWLTYPPASSWGTFTGAMYSAASTSTGFGASDNYAPLAMDQDFDWDSMGDGLITGFGE